MPKDTPLAHLTALQSAFERLQTYALPPAAAAALQSTVPHLKRLAEQLAASVDQNRLSALYHISQTLGTSLDLNEVLTQVMDAVIDLIHAERGFLVLLDPDTGELRLRAARNIEHQTLEDKDLEVSRTIIRRVIESGKGVVTTDALNDPRFSAQASVMMLALRSILVAPLTVGGRVIGVIYAEHRVQTGQFTGDDLDLLTAFATQAAVAIENAHLYTRTDQALATRVLELEKLALIDRELNAQLDLDRVLEISRKWAMQGTEATESWIALLGEENPALSIVAGPSQGALVLLDDPLVARCMEDGLPHQRPAHNDQLAQLVAPILQAGKFFGVLVVERSENFPEATLQFMDRLASRAASAIQNARLYQAVQQANLSKSRFVSVVTHEIRIPMTSIKGYSDLLRQGVVGPITEQQLSFLNVIRNNVERMSALISDLADINHMESGRLKLQLASLRVRDYVEEAVKNLRPKIEELKQTLTIDIPTDLPPVFADPNRLVQVLNNLLSNANKYTPEGGQITVRARPEGTLVRMEVIDTGIGISPEDQTHLFTQFFRSEDQMVREQQGWGLGLSVANQLVKLMGGEMGAESVLKGGTTFWFTLATYRQEGE